MDNRLEPRMNDEDFLMGFLAGLGMGILIACFIWGMSVCIMHTNMPY
jgi:hypothetical protein